MSRSRTDGASAPPREGASHAPLLFLFSLLAVEFLDELFCGVNEAAWPLMRDDLRLSYAEVGVLMSLPNLFGNLVEPVVGLLGDVWRRRALVVGGGLVYAAATLLASASQGFALLLVSFMFLSPAGGAFVGLSQATLMDAEPRRREQNMARWTLAGSVGNAIGPLVLGASVWAGGGWRWLFAAVALLTLPAVYVAAQLPFPAQTREGDGEEARTGRALVRGAREAWRALRRREVVRWLVMIEFGNLTWDVLRGFLALYFVDVAGLSESGAAAAVVLWTLAGLPGDMLLLPLLERVRGLTYLRWSTLATLVLFPLFLLAGDLTLKLVLLGLLGLANAGWYAILAAQLYASMPGRSGTVITLHNASGLVGSMIPLALGLFAQRYGLGAAMWLLLAGPAVLLVGLWKKN